MPRKKTASPGQIDLIETQVKTAPCVPAIRTAVKAWRENHYKGITATTELLLKYWFGNDHRVKGRDFKYHPFQREAIETLIYLFEVAKVRTQKDLLQGYASRADLKLLQFDWFAR